MATDQIRNQDAAPKAAEREMQKEQVLRLRAAGASYRQIERELGVSKSKAQELAVEALDDLRVAVRREAKHLLTLANKRLDDALRGAYSAMAPRQVVARGAGRDGKDIVINEVPPPAQVVAGADAIRRIEMDRARLNGILVEQHEHRWYEDPEDHDEVREAIREELMGTPAEELASNLTAFQLGAEAERIRREDQVRRARAAKRRRPKSAAAKKKAAQATT